VNQNPLDDFDERYRLTHLKRRRSGQTFGLLIVLILVLGAILHMANLKRTEGPLNPDNLPEQGQVPSKEFFEPKPSR
jgi:hypothetical protein